MSPGADARSTARWSVESVTVMNVATSILASRTITRSSPASEAHDFGPRALQLRITDACFYASIPAGASM